MEAGEFKRVDTQAEAGQPEQAGRTHSSVNRGAVGPPRRDLLLDYIVTHATDGLIDSIYAVHMTSLKANTAWIEMLEAESNERKLLRIAVSLGFDERQARRRKPGPARGSKRAPRSKPAKPADPHA